MLETDRSHHSSQSSAARAQHVPKEDSVPDTATVPPTPKGQEYFDIFEVPPSPLGSVQSTPVLPNSPPRISRAQKPPSPIVLLPHPAPSSPLSEPAPEALPAEPQDDNPEDTNAPRRTFRQRNAIQMHPYMLEQEKYRKSLQSRGIRPVAVSLQDSLQREHDNADTQLSAKDGNDDDGVGSDHSSSSYFRSSDVPNESLSQEDPLPVFDNDNDDIPDLNTLLQRQAPYADHHTHKRRKLDHQANAHGPVSTATHASSKNSSQPDAQAISTRASPRKRPRKPKFKYPKGFQPAHLPTPLPSSESKRPNATVSIHSDSNSDNEPRNVRPSKQARLFSPHAASPTNARTVTVLSDSSGSSDHEPQAATPAHLKKVQRKIRGVLPASWIRLDSLSRNKDKHAATSTARPRSSHAENQSPQKGIARRVSGSAHMVSPGSQGPPVYDLVSEAEDGSDASDGCHRSRQLGIGQPEPDSTTPSHQLAVEASNGLDVEERDWIDPMLPASSLRPKKVPQSKKKQLRISEPFHDQRNGARIVDSETRKSSSKKSKNRAHDSLPSQHRKQWVRRKKHPKVSILDHCETESRGRAPDFIKVATRKARRRPDKGRHSPSGKLMSMHTQHDGEEIDRTMSNWNGGGVKPTYRTQTNHSNDAISNEPLQPRSEHLLPNGPQVSKEPQQNRLGDGTLRQTSAKHTPRTKQSQQSFLEPIQLPEAEVQRQPSAQQTRQQRLPPRRFEGRNYPAQLEDLEVDHDLQHRSSAFQRRLNDLSGLTRPIASNNTDYGDSPFSRFLTSPVGRGKETQTPQNGNEKDQRRTEPIEKRKLHIRRRKRQPKRVEAEQLNVHRPIRERPALDEIPSQPDGSDNPLPAVGIQGLGLFGTRYSEDFGIVPLPVGICFRQSTLLGSGGLDKVIRIPYRDLSAPEGYCEISAGRSIFRLGAWSDDVASGLGQLLNHVARSYAPDPHSLTKEALSTNAQVSILRKLSHYISHSLGFFDSIDIPSFIAKSTQLLDNFFVSITENAPAKTLNHVSEKEPINHFLRILLLTFCISVEILLLARRPTLRGSQQSESERLVEKIGHVLITKAIELGQSQLWSFHSFTNIRFTQEFGISEVDMVAEVIVTTYHLTNLVALPDLDFWNEINQGLNAVSPPHIVKVETQDRWWHAFFAVFPFLEFDSTGLLRRRSGLRKASGSVRGAELVKARLDAIFNAYESNPHVTTSNDYLRTTLSRCHRLVKVWGWRNCELILGSINSFFARRGLAYLVNEESYQSSSFLEELNVTITPSIIPSDRSFQIFLKTLATGLISLQGTYPDKKIRNIVWRFIPNHGRSYKKDESLRQQDLDSLRNHHDLLTVLYYASPPSMRTSITPIRNLVDLKNSHSEVCHLSAHTWANLVRFQLSMNEGQAAIMPFVTWLNDLLRETSGQYEAARKEAEAFLLSTRIHGVQTISHDDVERTISANQRQIDGILSAILSSMQNLLCEATNLTSAKILFEQCHLSDLVLALCSRKKVPTGVLTLVLDSYVAFTGLLSKLNALKAGSISNDDSQDYGEFPDDAPVEENADTSQCQAGEVAASQIYHFMVALFGSDQVQEDPIYMKLVDVWIASASLLVSTGYRQWGYYLDYHGPGCWHHLRETEQTRKFGPYFYARVAERDPFSLDENSSAFFSAILVSLVERESMLKFQARLVTALMNARSDHPLMKNLPFVREASGRHFDISNADLQSRRLGLISSLLANMREHFEETFLASSGEALNLRNEYASMLKQMMGAMKKNYQEIHDGPTQRGTYIDFVQNIIQLLQHYVTEICPIDKYFTDSAAFPLPVEDPSYVIGKLKSFQVNSSYLRVQKKLSMFLQTVCERAASEHHQSYLAGQLKTSMQKMYETPDAAPSLQRLFLEGILPAYIKATVAAECGFVVGEPLLQVAKEILDRSLSTFDLCNQKSIRTMTNMATIVVWHIQHVVRQAMLREGFYQDPNLLKAMRRLFEIATLSLPLVDFLQRSIYEADLACGCLEAIGSFVPSIESFKGEMDRLELDPLVPSELARPPPETSFPELPPFVEKELNSALSSQWTREANSFYLLRGGTRRQIQADLGTCRQESEQLLAAAVAFRRGYRVMPGLCEEFDAFRI